MGLRELESMLKGNWRPGISNMNQRLRRAAGLFALLSIGFSTVVAPQSSAQSGQETDVLVVYNGASAISRSAAYYYLFSRNLSVEMLLELNIPLASAVLGDQADEEISRANYNLLIRDPVAARLVSLGADAPMMIVLMLGIPLRIPDESGSNVLLLESTGASVDAELAVLGSGLEGSAGIFTSVNPYFGSLQPFGVWRAANPGSPLRYLVTRIAGYPGARDQFELPAAIRRLVDRAQLPIDLSAVWVVDEDGTGSQSRASGDLRLLRPSTSLLRLLGLPVIHDVTTAIVSDVPAVMAYASWGSNDSNSPPPPFYGGLQSGFRPGVFAPRSIATTIVSTSARSFVAPPIYGQSLAADLVELGAAGVAGTVSEPGAFQVAFPQVLFTHYAIGATAAEAYYSSVPYLGWMNVWIGDPLMRLMEPDTDGDGVTDRIDECADTAIAVQVDQSGCSIDQFCSIFDPIIDDESLILGCKGADWQGDEPSSREPKDCRVVHETTDLLCAPR
jgi:uncharacterized protein (TIGR03790 family)